LATMLVLFSACEQSLVRPNDDDGRDSGLEVGIRRLYFSAPLVAAIAGEVQDFRRAEITLTMFPPHHTMRDSDIEWTAYPLGVAVVEPYGERAEDGTMTMVVHIGPDIGMLDAYDMFREATIRATYLRDTSVYAEAAMMILPPWGASRFVDFNWGTAQGTTNPPNAPAGGWPTVAERMHALGYQIINDEGDWHLGNGIFLLTGTGNTAPDPQFQGDNDALIGVFEIDPEEPYEYGITPLGTPRVLGSFQGDVRTAGDGMRALQIMGLQRPFEIEFEYATNANDPRWAYIRFGDTSGLRVEGPVSSVMGSVRRVRFRWDYYAYYTNRLFEVPGAPQFNFWYQERGYVLDENGGRIPRAGFVPVTFVEVVRGVRMISLRIITPADDEWEDEWTWRPVN